VPTMLTYEHEDRTDRVDGYIVFNRVEEFDSKLYAGYEAVRTASSQLVRQAPDTEQAQLYRFVREQDAEADDDQERDRDHEDDADGRATRKPLGRAASKLAGDAGLSVYCPLCSIMCPNRTAYDKHLLAKKHKKRAMAASLGPISATPDASSSAPSSTHDHEHTSSSSAKTTSSTAKDKKHIKSKAK